MEIRDYLRAIRRWLWLPIGVPLVAALLTGFLLESKPSQYQANATVIVPAVSAKGFSTSAAAQYVATFKDALISQTVVNEVSQKTGVPVNQLVAGLSASTISTSSNIIHVVFLGNRGENIVEVVREATVDTLDAVAGPQLVQAQNAVTVAQAELQKAEAAITRWTTTTGNILPQQEFNTQQQELDQLLLQLQQAKLANDTQRATALQDIISTRQQQLATLATQVTAFSGLADARQSALTVRDHAAQQLADAQALIAADQNPSTVSTQDVGRISKLADVIKFTAIAFAVALIMALGFILLLELMRGRTRPVTAAAEHGHAASTPEVHAQDQAETTPASAPAATSASGDSGNGANGASHRPMTLKDKRSDHRILRRR